MPRASLIAAAHTGVAAENVHADIAAYNDKFAAQRTADERKSAYERIVNPFYDLVTDFYEYGWGQSFHFAPRARGESFEDSLVRYESTLAVRIGGRPGHHLLDVGCGVGGPLRNVARLTGARITGLNNNAYQIERATHHNRAADLDARCTLVKGDFMAMPFEDEMFDGVYQIEATCHAPDRVGVFSEVFRVLRPGAVFAGYEWVLTDRYDPTNAEHRRIVHAVEQGNALPELGPAREIDAALVKAGFELLDCRDVAPSSAAETPWYATLTGREGGMRSFPRSRMGRAVTQVAVGALETLRIAPRGSSEVSRLLNLAADALVAAGELGIFTPMYLHVARKPA